MNWQEELGVVTITHKVGYGTFVSSTGTVLFVVAWINEISGEDSEDSVLTFWTVGIAETEEDAIDLLNRRTYPDLQESNGGSCRIEMRGNPLTGSTSPLQVQLTNCQELPFSDGGGDLRPRSSQQRGVEFVPIDGDEWYTVNNAGFQCVTNWNVCTTQCDKEFAHSNVTCEAARLGSYAVMAVTCIWIGAFNLAAGLICAAVTMFTDVTVVYVCRETYYEEHDVCFQSCRQLFQACCANPGTQCPAL